MTSPSQPEQQTQVEDEPLPLYDLLEAFGELSTGLAWALVCAIAEPAADHPAIAAVDEALADAQETFNELADAARAVARGVDEAIQTQVHREATDAIPDDTKETPT